MRNATTFRKLITAFMMDEAGPEDIAALGTEIRNYPLIARDQDTRTSEGKALLAALNDFAAAAHALASALRAARAQRTGVRYEKLTGRSIDAD